MATYVFFELPSTVVDSLENTDLWFERVPDLSDELDGDPYNFFIEAGAFLSVVGNVADLITISVATRDVARVLKNFYHHMRSPDVTIDVRGPRGKARFEVEHPDDEIIAHMAAIVSALAKPAVIARQERANLPPSQQ